MKRIMRKESKRERKIQEKERKRERRQEGRESVSILIDQTCRQPDSQGDVCCPAPAVCLPVPCVFQGLRLQLILLFKNLESCELTREERKGEEEEEEVEEEEEEEEVDGGFNRGGGVE
ncbi:hypothetical protein FQN60_011344, partial [Etheostoma spectabile]